MRVLIAACLIGLLVGCAKPHSNTLANESRSSTPAAKPAPKPESRESFEPTKQQRDAIQKALDQQPDFKRVGIKIEDLEVSGDWALANIEPIQKDAAEGAAVLLKNDGGWTVLDYGTDLSGDGEKFGVPQKLIDRWDL
jgi:hypothetical protein